MTNRDNDLPQTVWLVTIDTKHGVTVTVHASEQSAKDEVIGFALSFWDDEMKGRRKPRSDKRIVEDYFNEMADSESYSISEAPVIP